MTEKITAKQFREMRPKKAKYGNVKTTVEGVTFDSKKESTIYMQLLLQERNGTISELHKQTRFELLPAQYEGKTCIEKRCSYVADFTFYDGKGEFIILDVKGVKTAVYNLKKKLMYFVFGFKIVEV